MTPIAYIRVSTQGQASDGSGLDVQTDKIRAWCAYQGLGEPTIHSDVFSGATMNRPGFVEAVNAALDAGKAGALIVYKLDRLGRDAIDVQETLAVLLKAGVRVVSLADGVDSASGMGKALLKLLTALLASFAELERETIAERMRDGRTRAKETGRAYTRHAPRGYVKAPDGTLIPDPTEQAAIARAKHLRDAGLSFRAVGRALTHAGLKPRHGGTWTAAAIQRMTGSVRKNPGQADATRVARATEAMRARRTISG